MEADSGTAWIGRSVRRKEDHRLITGKGQYFGDVKAPEALHLVFVRSEHAHARIVSIDIAAAAAMPGIVCVVTGETIRHEIKPLPQPVVVPALEANFPTFWPLAVGKAKFHGEPVAAVVATDKYLAADAAEAVRVTYEPLPYVGDMEAALTPESPIVHEGWESNEIFATTVTGGDTPESEAANVAEVERIFAEAEIVIAQRFRMHRCGVTPLEPRGVMARWDSLDGMTAWITTQRPHIDRIAMSDVLDIPSDKLRVIAPRDQGGAFGVKAPFYREAILVCHLSRKLDATVRWQETRQEHLMAVSQERDQIHDLEIAATTEGKILALRDRGIADNGDGCAGEPQSARHGTRRQCPRQSSQQRDTGKDQACVTCRCLGDADSEYQREPQKTAKAGNQQQCPFTARARQRQFRHDRNDQNNGHGQDCPQQAGGQGLHPQDGKCRRRRRRAPYDGAEKPRRQGG